MAVAAAVSVILGLPALRVRGPFLAVSTLAFALTASTFLLQPRHFPWLVVEHVERPLLWGRLRVDRDWQMYELALVAFVAVAAAASALRRSRTGRAMVAVRDNEAAAATVSVSPVGVKLAAFAISGAMAGLAGALYVLSQNGVHPDAFTPDVSLRLFSMVVIGGLGSLSGAVLGAVYVRGAEFFLPAGWSLIASGAGIVALLLTLPGGLGEVLSHARDAFLRAVARRRGITAPSLMTDCAETDRAAPAAAAEATALGAGGPPGATPFLAVEGVDAGYDGIQILFGVDLEVEEGDIVALLGTNGAGKSTLLRAVSGLLRPSRGSILLDGQPIHGHSPGAIARLGVAQVPGGRGVFPTLSVADNLLAAGWLRRGDPTLSGDVDRVLEFFPVLRQRWEILAGELSGGEQQMLSLAQAFLMRPRLLLIDELSLGLAPAVVESLLRIVQAMADGGTTIVIVEQRVTTALRLARRAVFLEKGQVRFSGPTAELLDRPDVLHAVYLRHEPSPNPATAPAAAPAVGPPVLQTTGLTKRYGGITAAGDVDLTVSDGEIVGLIGPNGAGKTTVFDLVTGLARPDSGTVALLGTDVTGWPAHARARAGLGRGFQDARLWPSLTVEHAIAVAFERHHNARAALPAMLRLPVAVDAEAAVREEALALIELFGLGAFRNTFVAELSTGTRRIVEIATLMAHRPRVLLLDEPSSGIAQKEAEALVPVLQDLRAALGATLLVIDHDIALLGRLAERLVALHQGHVIADGPPADVLAHPEVAASFLGGRLDRA
jgi:ABC-type branched-subunit amino acid transport system ATPase component/branched-subunit amino acid ABC-type transport system permease component